MGACSRYSCLLLPAAMSLVGQPPLVWCCFPLGQRAFHPPPPSLSGAVYLLREVATVRPEAAEAFLPLLAEVATLKHFTHAVYLHTTIWTQFPLITKVRARETKAPGAAAVSLYFDGWTWIC